MENQQQSGESSSITPVSLRPTSPGAANSTSMRQPSVTRHAFEVLVVDDLVLGDEWESPARTVTETDVVLFAGLSGDFNPLHSNHEWSKTRPFGRPVAHGILGLAIATGLITHAPRMDT